MLFSTNISEGRKKEMWRRRRRREKQKGRGEVTRFCPLSQEVITQTWNPRREILMKSF